MNKYEVNISSIEYGWVEVEAENEQEAQELALDDLSMVKWVNSEIQDVTVKKVV